MSDLSKPEFRSDGVIPNTSIPATFNAPILFALPGGRGIIPVTEDDEAPIEYTERQHNLFFVYRLAKAVRAVCILQTALICVFASYSPVFVILLPFPICGYFGARWYEYYKTYIYSCYVVLEIFGSILSFFYVKGLGFIVCRALYLIFNITIARYATR